MAELDTEVISEKSTFTDDEREMTVKDDIGDDPRKKKRKKRLIIFAVISGIIVLLIAFSSISNMIKGKQNMKEMYTDTAAERRTIMNTITGSSYIEPNDSYSVTTIKSGDITADYFKEGDTVKKGDKLYQFDNDDAKKSLTTAQNGVTKAQNQLADAQRTYNDQYVTSSVTGKVKSVSVKNGDSVNIGMEIASVYDDTYMKLRIPFNDYDASSVSVGSNAQVTVAGSGDTITGRVTEKASGHTATASHTMVVYATVEVQNPGALTESDIGSVVVNGVACADTAHFEYINTGKITAKTSGTVNNLKIAEGDTVKNGQSVAFVKSDSAATTLSNSQLSLEDAKINLEKAQSAVEDYVIEAPIDGTVVTKNAKSGDTVDTGNGADPLCVIYDLSCVKLSIDVDETEIALVKTGQKATITADAVKGEFEGKVIKVPVDGVNQNGVTTYTIEVQIDDYGDLLPGMNVNAEIVVEQAENVISVPVNSVNRGNVVFVKDNGEHSKNDITDAMNEKKSSVGERIDKPEGGNGRPDMENIGREKGKPMGGADISEVPANLEIPEGYRAVLVETGINDTEYIEIKSGISEGDMVRTLNTEISSTGATFGSGPMQGGMSGMRSGSMGGGMSGGSMGRGMSGSGMSGGMSGGRR